MSHRSPAPTFWADKQAAWVARARNFSAAEARSAVEALNKHISTAAGSLSHRKVSLSQDADGFFAWAPSSLSLLQEMGDDVRLLDDIGRTTAAASPVKGNLPPPYQFSLLPPAGVTMDTILAFAGGATILSAWVSGC